MPTRQPFIRRLFGRSRRREYWLSLAALAALPFIARNWIEPIWAFLAIPVLPWLLIATRRLHDFGASGFWVLATPAFDLACMPIQVLITDNLHVPFHSLAPYIGSLILIVSLAFVLMIGVFPGAPGDNRFGPGRRAAGLDVSVFD